MTIKTIAMTDKAERSMEVAEDGNTVTCVRTVKVDENAATRCVVNWTFDLAGVTREELVTLAARTLVIDTQRAWRGAKDRTTDAWAVRTIPVRKMIDSARTRVSADPATQAARATTKMSKAELEILMAQIKEELGQ